jgi:hypothetical protein
MASDYQLLRKRASEDPGTAGDQGEENWKNLFRQWLPPAYHVVTKGRLLSAYDVASPQVDVLVLHPTYPPALREHKYYLADLVVAAFECKVTLKAEHIQKTLENARKISRLWHQDPGEPFRELYRPMIYGLLAHSHVWKGSKEDVRQIVAQRLNEADHELTEHPREMLDLITIADLATWESIKFPWNKTATRLSPTHELPTECPLTQYGCDWPGIPPDVMGAMPVARMLLRVLGQLSWRDQTLRNFVHYFQQAQGGSAFWGPIRAWPASIYSDQARALLESGEAYQRMNFPWNV